VEVDAGDRLEGIEEAAAVAPAAGASAGLRCAQARTRTQPRK
jgi:hypothetical protein